MVDVKPSTSPAVARCRALGLTPAAMADATGKSPTTARAWLAGSKRPSPDARRALASLGIDPTLWEAPPLAPSAPAPLPMPAPSAPAPGSAPDDDGDDDGLEEDSGEALDDDRADLAQLRGRLLEVREALRVRDLAARELAVLVDLEGRIMERCARARARIQLSERPLETPVESVHREHLALLRVLLATLHADAEHRRDWRCANLVRDALMSWPGEFPAAARARLLRFADLDAATLEQLVALVSRPSGAALRAANRIADGGTDAK